MKSGITIALPCAACALAACAQPKPKPAADLHLLYDAIAVSRPLRNPVVVLPGLFGTRLVDDESGRVVWGTFTGEFADPSTPEGARLFALPMDPGLSLAELTDGVRPDGALESLEVQFLGLPFVAQAYANILGALGVGGYRDEDLGRAGAVDYGDEHFTCFQFDYDWRRDLVESAGLLEAFLEEKTAYVQAERARRYGVAADAPVRFDIVAHSMGGVLARYYLRYGGANLPADGSTPAPDWAGAAHVERVVLVAPPNAGSANAIIQLVDGVQHHWLMPHYEPALLGTGPSGYQLLPRARHGALTDATGTRLDPLSPELWEVRGWGLADPDQAEVLSVLLPDIADPAERRRIALDHQRKCLERAGQLQAALDVPSAPPKETELYLVVGDSIPTAAAVRVDAAGGVAISAKTPGDMTVVRTSALLDERLGDGGEQPLVSPITWRQVLFLFEEHLELTQSPVFLDNLLYFLLEAPRTTPPG